MPSKCYMDILILTFCVKLWISTVGNVPQSIGVEKEGLLWFKYCFSSCYVPVCLSVRLRSFPRAATSRVWVPTTSPVTSGWAGNFRKKLTALVGPSHISHLRVPPSQGEIVICNACSDLSQAPHAPFRKD